MGVLARLTVARSRYSIARKPCALCRNLRRSTACARRDKNKPNMWRCFCNARSFTQLAWFSFGGARPSAKTAKAACARHFSSVLRRRVIAGSEMCRCPQDVTTGTRKSSRQVDRPVKGRPFNTRIFFTLAHEPNVIATTKRTLSDANDRKPLLKSLLW